MYISAKVYCSPHRYGPELKCCKSVLISFNKLSNLDEYCDRFDDDGLVST